MGFEFLLALLQFNHAALDFGSRDTFTDGVHKFVLFLINLLQLQALGIQAGGHLHAKPVELFGIFLAELRKILRFHQMMLEAIKDNLLQLIPPDGVGIITGALVASVRAAHMGLAAHAEAAAAAAALEKSRQEIRWSFIMSQLIVRLQGLTMLEGALLFFDLVPQGLIDDPEFRYLLDNPLVLRV
nr:hypothetical protein [Emcibacter sp.]